MIAKTIIIPSIITFWIHDNDRESQSMMIMALVNNLQMPKTFLDGNFIIKLISWPLVKKMSL